MMRYMQESLEVFPALGELNAAFGGAQPTVEPGFQAQFGPGQDLGAALQSIVGGKGPELSTALGLFMAAMPGSMRETLRTVIHYALTSDPPMLLNFSWAPGYDFEMTIWEIPEPAPARSAITILLKSRYPDHAERFAAPAPSV